MTNLKNVSICGVMGMATLTDDKTQISKEFKNLKIIFNTLKQKYFQHIDSFKEISMGMSGDYLIAIEQGSTIIRLGSVILVNEISDLFIRLISALLNKIIKDLIRFSSGAKLINQFLLTLFVES